MNEYDELLAGTATQTNEYDALIERQSNQNVVELKTAVTKGTRTPPDRAAQVLDLSRSSGLPPEIVDRNLDLIKQRQTVEQNDYEAMLRDSPKLVEWLKEGENAALVSDDMKSMGALEWFATAPSKAIDRGNAQVEFGNMMSEAIFRDLSAAEYKRLGELQAKMIEGGKLGAESWFSEALISGSQQVPMLLGGIKAGAETGIPAAVGAASAAAIAGQLGPQVALPEELATVPIAAATGYYIGSMSGAAVFGFRQEAGHAYAEFLAFKDETGRTLDPGVAKAAAVAAGSINAGLEVFQINTFLRAIPGADKLTGKITRDAIKDALRVPTVRQALADMMLNYGRVLTTETMVEVAQRAVTIMSGELAKSVEGMKTRDATSIGRDLVTEGVEAAKAFAYISAPGPFFRAGLDIDRAREAQKQQAFFEALGQTVQASKAFQRSPEAVQEFVARATRDGPIENVYVPVESWRTYWQSQNLDPDAAAREVLGAEIGRYEQAVATGADIQMPLSVYAARIAPTDANAFFAMEVRLKADELNAREAKELQERLEEQQRKATERTDLRMAEMEESFEKVKLDLKQRLQQAGVEERTAETQAEAGVSIFRSIAERTGISPEQLYQRYGLQVTREGMAAEGETAIEQPVQETQGLIIQHNITGPNILHALKLGGIPVPSLAITRAEEPMTSFGEITLIGPRDMADPRGMYRTRVFGSDIYSPRYPTIHYEFSDIAQKYFGKMIAKHAPLTGMQYFDHDQLSKEGARYLEGHPAVMAEVLEEAGVKVERAEGEDKYRVDMDTRHALQRAIDANNLRERLGEKTQEMMREMAPKEKIFRGFTYSGRRSYTPHTLENVVKILKKELRGGEGGASLYGIGSLRSQFSPQFRSLASIRKAKGRIVSDAAFEAIREEANQEFFALAEAMAPYYKHPREPFRYYDTVMAVLADSAKMGLTRAASEYQFNPLPDDVREQVFEFVTHLRNMPTEYFEAKILRGVPVSEFKAAAVPDNAQQDVIEALKDAGVQVEFYKAGSMEDRRRAVQELANRYAEMVMFQGATIDGNTGELVPQPPFYSMLMRVIEKTKIDKAPADQWKKLIASFVQKGVKKEEINASGILDWLDIVEGVKPALQEEAVSLISEGKPLTVALEEVGVHRTVAAGVLQHLLNNEITNSRQTDFTGEALANALALVPIQEGSLVPVMNVLEATKIQRRPSVPALAADKRVTKEQVIEFLREHHVNPEVEILGEPRAPEAAPPVGTQIPEGYDIEELAGPTFAVIDPDGETVAVAHSRQGAVNMALRDSLARQAEEEISEEDIRERAQALLEEDIPQMAEQMARGSDYANAVFDVVLRQPNYRIVELPPDKFRPSGGFGVQSLTYAIEDGIELDDGASGQRRIEANMPDDVDEWKEMAGEPRTSWATRDEFASADLARQWAIANIKHARSEDDGVAWMVVDPEVGENEFARSADTWDEASRTADEYRADRYQSEVEYYTSEHDWSIDDFGDRYINQAREELEEERGGEREPRQRRDTGIRPTRHARQWQSSGGRDYRELVIGLPGITPWGGGDTTHFGDVFQGRTIAWARFKTHEDIHGTPTLWIEEIQSKRAQSGRQSGFAGEFRTRGEMEEKTFEEMFEHGTVSGRPGAPTTPVWFLRRERTVWFETEQQAREYYNEQIEGAVPPAPFIRETQSWVALVLKRVLRYAVEHDISQIAWTTGDEQVARYGNWLREQIDTIEWEKTLDGIQIKAKKRNDVKVDRKFEASELRAAIGSDMATQIINDESQSGIISGENLTIDDLGMTYFYGDPDGKNPKGEPAIVPLVADRIARQLGGKGTDTIAISVSEGATDYNGATGVKITPEMRLNIMQGQALFQEDEMRGARGRIRFGADRQFRIDLLENADLSTFLHESGHFWLEVFGDVVDDLSRADPEALTEKQIRMVADYQVILDWLGVKSRADIKVEHHEKFARGIEAYFMEGRAPSERLRAVFARVRAWLISIYRSLRQLNVTLTPEVRGVMDRLVATDEEIEAASKEAEIAPLFATDELLRQAGFDEAFVNAYRSKVQAASDRAKDELQAKLMKVLTRERQSWWNDERAKMRDLVEAEISQRPEYIALAALQDGQMPDGTPAEVGPFKLARSALAPNEHRNLPRGVTTTEPGGVTPQIAAELFGFASGEDLLRALRAVRPLREAVEAETDNRMRAKHGDPATDGSMIDEAMAAVHNEARAEVIQAELRALGRLRATAAPAVALERARGAQDARARQEAAKPVLPLETVRRMANGRLAQSRVRDIQPYAYLTAARKASQAAFKALAAGDYSKAIVEKQRELFHVELYRAARNAQDEIEATADYMRSFGEAKKRARIAKAGQSYLDQIDGFLERYEFAKVSLRALERRKALVQWIAEREREGEPVALPDELQAERRVNYKDMTLEELRGVSDAVRNIEHLARLKNRLLTAKAKKDLAAAVEEIEDSIRRNTVKPRGRRIETRLPQDEAARLVDMWFASHRKLSSLVRQLDGMQDAGAVWQYILRPINEAGDNETRMNAETARKLQKLFGAYQGKDQSDLYKRTHIASIGVSLTKMARLMIALNSGNKDNRTKLMTGYGWNDQQLQSILDTLDERDWKFVQGTWDLINGYWPEIAAKEKRVTGLEPEKVEADSISTRFGEMRGGYFPLKYDDRQSPRAYADRAKEAAEQIIKGHYSRATTRRGHTKARVEGVNMPVRLDFGVIYEHLSQVVHDLSHHEMLIDVNRLLGAKEIQNAIIEGYGDVIYKEIQRAVADIAAGDVPVVGAFEKSINWGRQGMTIAWLGWNFMTSLLQPFGITQSIVRIGPKWVGRGLSRWLTDAAHMENTAHWIREKSSMMNHRMDTQLREINEIRNQIGIGTGKLSGWVDQALRTVTLDMVNKQAVVDSYFWMIYKGQQIADIPTWLGAYEKALDQGQDEATAIALADQAVLDSQGGGMVKDLAGIQRGTPLLKIWTNFYSYFNVTWNLSVESARRTKTSPASIARLGADLLLLYTLPATLTSLMRAAIIGDDDDEDKLASRVIRDNISYMLGVMIGLREMGSVVQGFSGYEGPAGARFFSSMSKLVKQIEQGEADLPAIKRLNEVAGVFLHYPAGQVNRTIDGFVALQEGRTSNPLALLTGGPRD